ncbi:MAG: hypothetical protein M1814_004788 [Vezdaea aestivalis]|nr:MAG: hypothetical protein M1814_004788 [Vezdaea aestivalis]
MVQPDAIHGDLDSLRPSVRKYYAKQGVPVIEDSDQESTDFTKCVKFAGQLYRDFVDAEQSAGSEELFRLGLDVVALGGFTGRLDQSLSQLHELFSIHSNSVVGVEKLWLVSEVNVSFVLDAGKNLINTPMDTLGPSAGIVPLKGKAVISTEGLVYDVKDWKTQIGGNVSTSNYLKQDKIKVDNDDEVLFTVEIRGVKKDDNKEQDES